MVLNIATEFKRLIFLINHPVGSVYMSMNSTNPNTFYGGNCGTWARVEGYYLYGNEVGGDNLLGQTFGRFETELHQLTYQEMPNHSHTVVSNVIHGDGELVTAEYLNTGIAYGQARRRFYSNCSYEGGNQGHSHIFWPPSKRTAIWVRTA